MDDLNRQNIKIKEAIIAGKHALSALTVTEYLLGFVIKSSKCDIFDSERIGSAIIHCRAHRRIIEARRALKDFNRKLSDLELRGNVQVNYDELRNFFARFDDNTFINPSRFDIRRAKRNIKKVKRRVKKTLYRLYAVLL